MNTMELWFEIVQFLNKEAELLDNYKFKEWLELWTADAEYIMYSRLNVVSNSVEQQLGSPMIMDNRTLLEKRVNRLYTEYAWAEIPRSMTRHFVTNVRIDAILNENEVKVLSNVLFYRHKHDNLYHELFSYERSDILRKVNGAWKIARREIIPDTNIVLADSLTTFY
ncbi:aromatic-ring-hydroxylating dioxygenase subunit beta [Sulfolobus sp. E5-1-F]|uniref:aromatic-ring-hydroxylating dioxygenase subunit beta n=1 Tax=Saccharolobus sp. E5-1-F TaxID=2663019 RepID=UPI0012969757|nr:aromatic-ring-hydroxylating dioxygenase subunit beta [Sulfolobus sp. E5-1-F]QGA54004.1 aromatic-ring-hydroxylating dioxygenase subunit beta [Sulfolobus sp. E5-1-F]